MAWNKGVPSGTISPCASTVQLTSNFQAINDWWNVEHYTFSSSLSGLHKAGIMGTVLTGTHSAISAISSPGTGSLCYDNTCGYLSIYRSSGAWKRLTEDHYSRVKLTASSQSVAATAWTDITFDTEVYDSLGEYTLTNLRVVAEGYYLIQAIVNFPSISPEKAVAIYVDGVRYSQSGGYGPKLITIECMDIVKASANSLIDLYVYNGSNIAVDISSATLMLTRLS